MSNCPGQVNFALGQVKIEVWWPRWASEINLSSLVTLSESVSLITITNKQTQRWGYKSFIAKLPEKI